MNEQDFPPLSKAITANDESDILTAYGIKISGALLRAFNVPTREGLWFRVIKVEGEVCTIQQRDDLITPESQWIPIAERKPVPHDTILLTNGEWRSSGYWTGERFQIDVQGESDPGLVATHWAPFPLARTLPDARRTAPPGRRSPHDGKPYYCAECGLGYQEYLACDDTHCCRLESEDEARARSRAPE